MKKALTAALLAAITISSIPMQAMGQAKQWVTSAAQSPQVEQAMNYARDTISTIKNKLASKQWSTKEKLALTAALVYLAAALRTAQSQRLRGFRAVDPRRVVLQQLPGDVHRTRVWLKEKIATPLFQ